MERALQELVRRRARNCCEYCRVPQRVVPTLVGTTIGVSSVFHGTEQETERTRLAFSARTRRCNSICICQWSVSICQLSVVSCQLQDSPDLSVTSGFSLPHR